MRLYLFLSMLDLLRLDGKIGLTLALYGLGLKVDDHLLDLHRRRVLVQHRFDWNRFDIETSDWVEYACIAGLETWRNVGRVRQSVLVSKRESAISEFGQASKWAIHAGGGDDINKERTQRRFRLRHDCMMIGTTTPLSTPELNT